MNRRRCLRAGAVAAAVLSIFFAAPVCAQSETCIGDCNYDGAVHVDELVRSVSIALGEEPVGGCTQLDFDGNGQVTIDELMQAVRGAIVECKALTRLTGTCEKPGASGLAGCPENAPIELFRCDDRSLCLKGSGRTLVDSASVGADGNFSLQVDSAPVHSFALLLEAQVEAPAQTRYGVFAFSSLGGSGGGAALVAGIAIDPGSEAALRLIDEYGLENFADDGVLAVIQAVEHAVAEVYFGGLTAEQAASVALETARADAGVQEALRAHVTPSATASATLTPTAIDTSVPVYTSTPTRTSTHTSTPTAIPSSTASPTSTPTATTTITPTVTPTSTLTATLTPTPVEFPVNAYTTLSQFSADVAADDANHFVVVWTSDGRDGSDGGVFARRFESPRAPIGLDFQVNTFTAREQAFARVAADPSGAFVVVWRSVLQDGGAEGIFGQRFASDGLHVGTEFQVNAFTLYSQDDPDVATDPSGGFVAVWDSDEQDADSSGIFARRFDSAGDPIGAEFQVNSYTIDGQRKPRVALDGQGRFLVVWGSRFQDGDGFGVFARRFASDGSPFGGDFQVNVATELAQSLPAVGVDPSGQFLVAWRSQAAGGTNRRIDARSIGANAVAGAVVAVSDVGAEISDPDVAPGTAGKFLITWTDRETIFGREVGTAQAIGEAFQISAYTPSPKGYPSAALTADGHFVVVWESFFQDGSYYGVFGRSLDAAP